MKMAAFLLLRVAPLPAAFGRGSNSERRSIAVEIWPYRRATETFGAVARVELADG